MGVHRQTLETFDLSSIPDLDVVVLGALELFADTELPKLDFSHLKKPLVLGSVNAYMTAQIVFADTPAVFADEASYKETSAKTDDIDGVVVFSASGSKHAVAMVKDMLQEGLEVHLVTNTPGSLAGELLSSEFVHVFPKNREPYTYNTSTYLSTILGRTGEDAVAINDFIMKEVSPKLLRNFGDYSAYSILIPSRFKHVRAMLRTKFDELFGPHIIGRVFTDEEVKHAKTVVTSGNELFISFGVENKYYGLAKNRLQIPLPENVDYGALLAISYFVVGQIQKANPSYFKNNIEKYTKTASEIFDQEIKPIVE
ncbi:MAG: hypothetical protein ACI92I_000762 [Acidimicrobiales bacterium]|jgi:hypothetical protein